MRHLSRTYSSQVGRPKSWAKFAGETVVEIYFGQNVVYLRECCGHRPGGKHPA